MMLAQSVDSLPAEWLKNAVIFIAAIAAAAYYIKGIFFDKKHERRIVSMEKGAATEEICALRHRENTARLEHAEGQIQDLWSTMRDEDKQIRANLDDKFSSIQRLLGRIEQKIDSK